MDEIISFIDDKRDLLIYIEDDVSECGYCKDTSNIIDFYEDNYNLDFFRFDRSKTTDKDFDKLIDYFDIPKDLISLPMLVLVKKGKYEGMANFVVSESFLRQQLINGGFIDDKYVNLDSNINYEKFEKIYSSGEKSLLVVYDYNKSTYKIREVMLDIVGDKDISYYTVYNGFSDSVKITNVLRGELKNNFYVPSLVVVKDKKVLDNLNSMDKDKIIKFLRKHGFIE